jgi:hypothetical protein
VDNIVSLGVDRYKCNKIALESSKKSTHMTKAIFKLDRQKPQPKCRL